MEGDGLDGNAADASPKCMEFHDCKFNSGNIFCFFDEGLLKSILFCGGRF